MGELTTFLARANDWNGHMDWGGGWWMIVWGTLMMGGLVLLGLYLVRSMPGSPMNDRGSETNPTDRAHTILAERYARGELTSEEYQERLANLKPPE